jgi:hypothetical protein
LVTGEVGSDDTRSVTNVHASAAKRLLLVAAWASTATCASKQRPDCGCAEKKARLASQASASSSALPPPALPLPHTFLLAPEALAKHKARWLADPGHPEPALSRLFTDAAKALAQPPFSVTEKSAVPPSGDTHDYLSLAPYAWPNPSRPDGLPYVMRDGRINPERDSIPDHLYFSRIVSTTEALGLAYYFTGDERFAEHGALLLRAFFADSATRMNPNLQFAQGVRGKEPGRASGLIDTAEIGRLIDGVQLLVLSTSFDSNLRDGLSAWFRDYLAWLEDSDLGRKDGRSSNNQGTWYDVQVVALALATGQSEFAQEVLLFSRKRRIGREIEPDGSQPDELARTRSWHYCVFNLRAFVALASLGERAGVNLWRYQTSDGRAIRKAIDWLLPYALGQKPWATPEIGGVNRAELWPVVRLAAYRLNDPQLAQVAAQLGAGDDDRLVLAVE